MNSDRTDVPAEVRGDHEVADGGEQRRWRAGAATRAACHSGWSPVAMPRGAPANNGCMNGLRRLRTIQNKAAVAIIARLKHARPRLSPVGEGREVQRVQRGKEHQRHDERCETADHPRGEVVAARGPCRSDGPPVRRGRAATRRRISDRSSGRPPRGHRERVREWGRRPSTLPSIAATVHSATGIGRREGEGDRECREGVRDSIALVVDGGGRERNECAAAVGRAGHRGWPPQAARTPATRDGAPRFRRTVPAAARQFAGETVHASDGRSALTVSVPGGAGIQT